MRQLERRAATREAILNAAQRLFANSGVEATTIDAIVAAAEVARGSFYYNFDSKEQVVLAIGRRDFARAAARIDRRLARGDSPSETLRDLLLTACRWNIRNRHLARVMLFSSLQTAPPVGQDTSQSRSFRKLADSILAAGQQRGEIRRDFAAIELAEMLTGLFIQAALYWVQAPKPGRLDHWVDRSLTIFLQGAQPRENA
jgi:AcrR family transcriptional regulator